MIRSRAKTKSSDEQHLKFTSLPIKMNAWYTARMLMMFFAFIALFAYIAGYSSNFSAKMATSRTGNPCLDEPMRHQGVPTFKVQTSY
jgi:quinol-cytochrome oxidoreductase complex cytochrome b subunit